MDQEKSILRSKFKQRLQASTRGFKITEKTVLDSVFKEINRLATGVNLPSIAPIELIKIGDYTVSEGAFYTRQHQIIIPEAAFRNMTFDQFLAVMFHELFHILSRNHPNFKTRCYKLIGFNRIEGPLFFPKNLKDRLLLNPDGLASNYLITLDNGNGKTIDCIPLLTSKSSNYKAQMPDFFSYMEFDLYPVKKSEDGYYIYTSNLENGPTIQVDAYQDFFDQIKDNTTYTIHPDEVLADNFTIAMLENENPIFLNYSKEGKVLLLNLLDILKAHK